MFEKYGKENAGIVLKAVSIVFAAIYAISIFPNIAKMFSGFFSIMDGHILYGVLGMLSALLLIVAHAAMAAALALFALCRDDGRDNTEVLLLTVLSAGILCVLVALAAPLLNGIGIASRSRHFRYNIAGAAASVRLALISAGAVTGLTFLVGMKPFVGKSTDELLNEVKHLPSTLGEEIELFLSQRRRKTETTETGTVPMPPSDTPATSVAPRRMNEKRSFLMFLLVGILTCGVYIWYVYYTLARDINEICKEDGETTAGLVKLILFTLITCTIYHYVWHYKFMNRIQNNASHYEINVK